MTDTRKKLLKIEEEMNGKFINRNEVVRGLVITLLARGNIVLLGPAGTGKTDLVQTLARCINGQYFETILTKMSSPEELFGPYNLKELEEGNYVRNTTNTAVDSEVAFVDEVFKCNSATLNGLLGLMAQRVFRNGGSAPSPTPTELFVGASNELPEGGIDGPLAALWDRFEMRFMVDYLRDKASFNRLLSLSDNEEPKTSISIEDIRNAREELAAIETEGVTNTIISLWDSLNKEGYRVSDRKWRNSLRYMKANAYLEGRKSLTEDDILLLKDMAWQTTEQIKPVRKLVLSAVNPDLEMAQDLFDAACEIFAELSKFTDDDNENKKNFGTTKSFKVADVHNKLVRTKKIIQTTTSEQKKKGKNTSILNGYMNRVNEMLQAVTAMLIGG